MEKPGMVKLVMTCYDFYLKEQKERYENGTKESGNEGYHFSGNSISGPAVGLRPGNALSNVYGYLWPETDGIGIVFRTIPRDWVDKGTKEGGTAVHWAVHRGCPVVYVPGYVLE